MREKREGGWVCVEKGDGCEEGEISEKHEGVGKEGKRGRR
jgi:hypothetical protein